MQIALGNAEQPAFVSKTRARWQDTRRRYEAAADRLDRSADHEDRKLAGDVRTFLQKRANIETVPDRMLRDAEARVIAARPPARTDPSLEPGVPRGRSEEHTSELQSLMRSSYAVLGLKKKT